MVVLKENDVEREVNMYRTRADYVRAESWKWFISGRTKKIIASMTPAFRAYWILHGNCSIPC